MEKYDSYKFSGIDWIGEIPSHWEAVKLKYLTESRKELSEDGCEELLSVTESRGIVKRQELKGNDENLSRSENLTGYRLVKQGNLVNNIMLMWKRGLGVSSYNGIVSPAYSVFSFINNCHPAYFHYLLRSEEYITEFRRNSTGVVMSRLRLYDDSFGSIFSHYPPANEQKLISRYLDKKNKQIDSLIEKIQKKIELLKEQRTSLINQCVTKGLDPNVEMKDSGVEWIGEIPNHWKITRLGFEAEVIDPQPDHRAPEMDKSGFPYVGIRDIDENGYVNIDTCRFVKLEAIEKQENSYTIDEGDLIFCKVGTLGAPRFFKKPETRFALSATLVIIKVNKKNDPRFINYALRSGYIDNFIKFESTGSTRKALGIKIIRDFKIALPPLEDQKYISTILDNKTSDLSQLILKLKSKIDLLKEYRQSLISSVVTGKVRVAEDMI